jgi:hypothetical protein
MISFLLPTRDRLDYLKLAIETVRRQDCSDWEIVISDNDSAEDIAGHVHSLGDDRIRYSRTDRALAVTENWNAALSMSCGDYVLMLGDDDGVLPGYITHMQALTARFDQPDAFYTGSLLFTYPGVDPDQPAGSLVSNTHAEFAGNAQEPFVLTREQAIAAVRRSMNFELAFSFNMQHWLLSRPLIDELASHGPVFQSAFPDYYASCATLLTARRVVFEPRELVVIGVTPKSYGFFHLNQRESEGRAFLEGGDVAPQVPGTNINVGWLSAMEAVEANYGTASGLRVNRRRFRLLQAAHVYARQLHGSGSPEEVADFEAGLPGAERLLARCANRAAQTLIRVLPARAWSAVTRRAFHQFPATWGPRRDDGTYANLLDVFEGASRQEARVAPALDADPEAIE